MHRAVHGGYTLAASRHVSCFPPPQVLYRRKLNDCSVADPRDFITRHAGFKHPSCVLRPTVSLYCLTRHEAVFVETPDGKDVYSGKGGPLFLRQFSLATHVVTMPLASFHKIASDVGAPRVPLTWLSCTPRSGSCLLAHVLGSAPNLRVLHEPDAVTCLGRLRRDGSLPAGEYTQLLASAVRLLCKPDDRCGAVLLKARPCVTRMMQDVYPAFPRARYLYLYRNSLKTLHSVLAAAAGDPAGRALRLLLDSRPLSALFPCARRWLHSALAGINEKPGGADLKASDLTASGLATAAWASGVAACAELRDRGLPVRAVLYEDVMRSPQAACSELFRLLELRPEHVPQALQVFRRDFNRSPPVSAADSRLALPHDARQEANLVLKKHGLPKLGERVELAGLIKFE